MKENRFGCELNPCFCFSLYCRYSSFCSFCSSWWLCCCCVCFLRLCRSSPRPYKPATAAILTQYISRSTYFQYVFKQQTLHTVLLTVLILPLLLSFPFELLINSFHHHATGINIFTYLIFEPLSVPSVRPSVGHSPSVRLLVTKY